MSTWIAHTSPVQSAVAKITITTVEETPLSFRDFFAACQDEPDFANFFSGALKQINSRGFFWELPPLIETTVDQQFQCVVVGSETLTSLTANSRPFNEHFSKLTNDESVTVFPNLSGDAVLVVPAPIHADLQVYPHFANFLNGAEEEQIASLWKAVGKTAQTRISNIPFWLSTAGLGVSWLHLRFDSRPKYYRFQPYKNPDFDFAI